MCGIRQTGDKNVFSETFQSVSSSRFFRFSFRKSISSRPQKGTNEHSKLPSRIPTFFIGYTSIRRVVEVPVFGNKLSISTGFVQYHYHQFSLTWILFASNKFGWKKCCSLGNAWSSSIRVTPNKIMFLLMLYSMLCYQGKYLRSDDKYNKKWSRQY